eukprot:CAMPEP_0170516588 /NCGR_PEP_ID=MMETSP0209-20121228/2766_1 /TAXON_ID=665100 ORGANISM="Litonotus pictus, Strain P1" /NCGR_SAMPLE_ID=MMETSP0209 /ASSEMBLY_ACC=CAM_ASM_000301 /LENGTH=168 /DNA_ID=CAMNT_0010801527 /DNA_START=820 /DNA_END=1326 /DNA_ORIENTATION=+
MSYELAPEQLDNFYLFLTSEKCFKRFYYYLLQRKDSLFERSKSLLSLELFTKIQSFRLYFTLEEDYFKVLDFAKALCVKYFIQPERELLSLLNSSSQRELKDQIDTAMNKNEVYLEHFDFVMVECYQCLIKHFHRFKHSKTYEDLVLKFYINNCVQDSLINVGLIDRY